MSTREEYIARLRAEALTAERETLLLTRPARGSSSTVPVRFQNEDLIRLHGLATADGLTVAEYIRVVVRRWLTSLSA